MKKQVDINCDMGEGLGNEHLLMPFISSCSIACGGHAGDEETMKKVSSLAMDHHVNIGAHPSYPDKENFGRKSINILPQELMESIKKQVNLLKGILQERNEKLYHIKAHGALYNDIAKDHDLAKTFLEAVSAYRNDCFLYVPFRSVIADLAIENGFKTKFEAFADRNYNDDLSLVSRDRDNALITNMDEVVEHVLIMIEERQVKTINGNFVSSKADTFCVHSDTENAAEIVEKLHGKLINLGYKVGSF